MVRFLKFHIKNMLFRDECHMTTYQNKTLLSIYLPLLSNPLRGLRQVQGCRHVMLCPSIEALMMHKGKISFNALYWTKTIMYYGIR
jgi:hypothetical protein